MLSDALTSTAWVHVHAFELTVFLAEHHRAAANGLAVGGARNREDDLCFAEVGDIDAMVALQRVQGHLIRIQFFDEPYHVWLIRGLDRDRHGCSSVSLGRPDAGAEEVNGWRTMQSCRR